jgi:NAD(P) transhydrogenase subunit alpha
MSDAFLQAEMALFAQQAMEVDIIITTALIPGKPAPKLITTGMVESMKPGSVIVDLAAEQGGNCAMTEPGTVVTHKGVTIIGYTDLPSRMASLSSQLIQLDDRRSARRTARRRNGGLKVRLRRSSRARRARRSRRQNHLSAADTAARARTGRCDAQHGKRVAVQTIKKQSANHETESSVNPVWLALAGAALLGIGLIAPASKLGHFTVFMLACFVGWQLVWNVKPALHTPLMSVTNAISGIILVGGMLQLSGTNFNLTSILGAIAVLIATINIAGGFLVTNRMLAMFRKKKINAR